MTLAWLVSAQLVMSLLGVKLRGGIFRSSVALSQSCSRIVLLP